MKQFNLEEYLKNPSLPVITREGKRVRIICTDAKSIYPVIGLVDNGICGERFVSCQKNGRESNDVFESKADLFFAEKNERKHEGWVNIFRGLTYNELFCGKIYASKEKAESYANDTTLATIKIEWEE